ncbi:MAG: IS605 OrfB-like transposable element containing RNAse H-like and Zn finger domain [Candidatus Methanohalarchaeum thermophilum]|uniref:IS605 OrfB-like transposable element containing RNAse H-like and Zn finger domain n=1 Tax=Methanohalarchaeum thermophilum TaxID=1903181 RepID=A0A1Q6DUH9_METT1|nr:MAG: IS605 OrfB-like transposable element containing RNAse H-like and Zn finger domain [Candidatus Methanohalarchaeum thermophilum]
MPKSDKKPITKDSNVVGMDLNVSNFLLDIEGREVQDLKTMLAKKYERIKKEQRELSRKGKGSNNWKKQKKRLAKIIQETERCTK